MGISDRDYFRSPPPTRGGFGRTPLRAMGMWSVNTWLIVICISMFVLDGFLPKGYVTMAREFFPTGIDPPAGRVTAGPVTREIIAFDGGSEQIDVRPIWLDKSKQNQIGWREMRETYLLESWLHHSTNRTINHFEFWRLIGFQFLHTHAFLAHILLNMFALFIFGPLVERHLGSKRYLAFYLLSGICGAMAYSVLNLAGVVAAMKFGSVQVPGLIFDSTYMPLIGASAGVFGVLMAGAYLAPQVKVLVMFILPVQLRTLAYAMVALSFVSLMWGVSNQGGHAAHLGGAVAGWYFIRKPHHLHGFFDFIGRVDPTSHHYQGARWRSALNRAAARGRGGNTDESAVDSILDKVQREGVHSLTARERRILERASRR